MIAQNISMKLEGRHYEAFRAFALRSGARTTTENVKRLIETLPEYQSLLNIHVNANPSVERIEMMPNDNRIELKSQGISPDAGGEVERPASAGGVQ